MEHESERRVSILVIESLSFSKPAWFHVSLAFPGSQRDVPTSSAVNHATGNFIMLAVDPVLGHIRTVHVPFKMSLDLIFHILKVGIYG